MSELSAVIIGVWFWLGCVFISSAIEKRNR